MYVSSGQDHSEGNNLLARYNSVLFGSLGKFVCGIWNIFSSLEEILLKGTSLMHVLTQIVYFIFIYNPILPHLPLPVMLEQFVNIE